MRKLTGISGLLLCGGLLACQQPFSSVLGPHGDLAGSTDQGAPGDSGISTGRDLGTRDFSITDLLAPGDLAGQCNALANYAPVITPTMVNQPLPSATMGGTIQPGVYFLTQMTIYQGGTKQPPMSGTKVISGDTFQIVISLMSGPTLRYTQQVSTTGTSLTEVQICPANNQTSMTGYDATPTQLTIYDATAKWVYIWTKQ